MTDRSTVWAVTLLLASTLAAPAAGAQPPGPPAGYRLVWADEFDTDGPPDAARWSHDTAHNKTGWHNHELQYYGSPADRNAVVSGGRLRITARRETPSTAPDWGGQRYTSARLLTRGLAEWTYGFFEVRAKMPCGLGTWPAIWMLGSGGRWPDDGELDILEHLGSQPDRVFSTVHTAAGSGGHGVGGAQRLPDACTAFHDYQMHWTPEGVAFAVDGFQHFHYARLDAGPRPWPFDKPQFLLLNLAIGGDLGGPVDDSALPATLEIDHVRVYQKP
ncbi:glycoside hydrolase family 16 protein [Ideonella sp.]|uniref:glycoside hydrolase family 16 protein n=1 Tax=Ideonella sp. TaxID=1929293 RepID=UPI002B498AB3|nr:glycoside hydrolase family 16 protein [Ideonella sp.]HJV67848.1 glycoside hydrolase family 16 protein [Ideonella sp.]